MKANSGKRVMSIFAHIVLILLSFMCLFFFAILLINATHSHAELQKGFSIIPGKHFMDNREVWQMMEAFQCSEESLTVWSCPDALQHYVHTFLP